MALILYILFYKEFLKEQKTASIAQENIKQ